MKCDPMSVSKWKHRWGFHNRGVVWDAPMATWAGEGKKWVTKHVLKKTAGTPRTNKGNWFLWFS